MFRSFLLSLSLTIAFPVYSLDLIEAYQLAKDEDQAFIAAKYRSESDKEGYYQAEANLLPQININANTSITERSVADRPSGQAGFDERFNSNGYELSINQPIYNRSLWQELSGAKLRQLKAEADLFDQHQDLILRVSQAYFEVLQAEDAVTFQVRQQEAFSEQLKQAQNGLKAGLNTVIEVHQARASLDQAIAEEISAQQVLTNAQQTLANQLNEPVTVLSRLGDKKPSFLLQEALQDSVNLARKNNSSLESLRLDMEVQSKTLESLRSDHLPTLDAVVRLGREFNGGVSFIGGDVETQFYGLQLTIPVYSGGRTSSEIRQAEFTLGEVRAVYQEAYRQLQRDVTAQYMLLESNTIRIQANQTALDSSENVLTAMQRGYEIRTRRYSDVLQAQQDLLQSQQRLNNSVYEYILGYLEYQRLIGDLNQEDLIGLNSYLINNI